MTEEKRFLADVGIKNIPFPMKVLSKANPDGQLTIANISVTARIMQEFEAGWIDRVIRILHRHRGTIGTHTLKQNVGDYIRELNATMVRIDFDYPFFVEKVTPVSKEKCITRYNCTYSAKITSIEAVKILFKISVPVITTYPQSFVNGEQKDLFGQLSTVAVETESSRDIYPEDLVDIVDRHSLVPMYSFLTDEDQRFVIRKIHSERKDSVLMLDEIKEELSRMERLDWFAVRCQNFGMLHSYSTVIANEKAIWFSGGGAGDIMVDPY